MKGRVMTDCTIICPECSAEIITADPEALIWELCSKCHIHEWEISDLIMAETAPARKFQDNDVQIRLHAN